MPTSTVDCKAFVTASFANRNERLGDELEAVPIGDAIVLQCLNSGLRGHLLEISTGCEHPWAASQNQDATIRIGVERLERLRHLLHQRRKQRVERLWPVERD